VLILSTGRVEQRVIEVPVELTDELIGDLRVRVNRSAVGEHIADAAAALGDLPDQVVPETRAVYSIVVAALVEAMSDHRSDERVVVGGTANLARFGDSFEQSIKPMLEALEEHVVLLKLLGEATSPSQVTVTIGHEGPFDQLSATSVVATGYGSSDEALASLGIVGPTRMDYPGSMAAVRAVARYVSTILDEG
jgi:heat-inducible transcriptional repressor